MRKCIHGVSVGPLDDYGVLPEDDVRSTYCSECNPRIVKNSDGSHTATVEEQYLSREERAKVHPYCPDCGSALTYLWSGVKCSSEVCNYWFCY